MAAKRHEVTEDSLIQELEEARNLAKAEKQTGSMVAASMGKAKITGHIIERKEHGMPGEFASLDSADEIIEALRAQAGDDAADMLKALIDKQKVLPEPTHDAPEAPQ